MTTRRHRAASSSRRQDGPVDHDETWPSAAQPRIASRSGSLTAGAAAMTPRQAAGGPPAGVTSMGGASDASAEPSLVPSSHGSGADSPSREVVECPRTVAEWPAGPRRPAAAPPERNPEGVDMPAGARSAPLDEPSVADRYTSTVEDLRQRSPLFSRLRVVPVVPSGSGRGAGIGSASRSRGAVAVDRAERPGPGRSSAGCRSTGPNRATSPISRSASSWPVSSGTAAYVLI